MKSIAKNIINQTWWDYRKPPNNTIAVVLSGGTHVLEQRNFIMIHYWNADTEAMFQYLREHGIVVRHFQGPRIGDYLRVTIGNRSDMRRFLDAVEEYIS